MGFVLKKRNTFFWPIEIKEPAAGAYDIQKIEIEFHKLSDTEVKELFTVNSIDKDVCKRIIAGWKNVKDDEGKDVEFSTAQLALFLDNAKYAGAIIYQYLKVLDGIIGKN